MQSPGQKFRFRPGLAAWQSRNVWPISAGLTRANAVNHGIVTDAGVRPISEFLIVGCDHGWLGEIGYDRGRFELAGIRVALGA